MVLRAWGSRRDHIVHEVSDLEHSRIPQKTTLLPHDHWSMYPVHTLHLRFIHGPLHGYDVSCSISVDRILNAQLNDSKWCYTSNSNDCELPSGQATPSTLAKDVACGEAVCGGGHAINRILYLYNGKSESDSPGTFVLATPALCWELAVDLKYWWRLISING